MPTYRILTETFIRADSEEEAWDQFGSMGIDELAWDIEIVKTD